MSKHQPTQAIINSKIPHNDEEGKVITMKTKRTLSMLIIFLMVVTLIAGISVPVYAKGTINITSPNITNFYQGDPIDLIANVSGVPNYKWTNVYVKNSQSVAVFTKEQIVGVLTGTNNYVVGTTWYTASSTSVGTYTLYFVSYDKSNVEEVRASKNINIQARPTPTPTSTPTPRPTPTSTPTPTPTPTSKPTPTPTPTSTPTPRPTPTSTPTPTTRPTPIVSYSPTPRPTPTPMPMPTPPPATALYADTILFVNGVYQPNAWSYNINDSNYCKLRDLAAMFVGTPGKFSIGYDSQNNLCINLGSDYQKNGTELLGNQSTQNENAVPSTVYINLNGQKVPLICYNIEGSIYVATKDFMNKINGQVEWVSSPKTLYLDTWLTSSDPIQQHPYVPSVLILSADGKTFNQGDNIGTFAPEDWLSVDISGQNCDHIALQVTGSNGFTDNYPKPGERYYHNGAWDGNYVKGIAINMSNYPSGTYTITACGRNTSQSSDKYTYLSSYSVNFIVYNNGKISATLNDLKNTWNNQTWKEELSIGGKQCKGFAGYVFNELFHCGNIGNYPENPTKYYVLNILNDSAYQVGDTVKNADSASAKNLLTQASPGDFIQIQRRVSQQGHSMIVVSVSENGIDTIDANSDGNDTVLFHSESWDEFSRKNINFSLYHATNYDDCNKN